METPDRGWISTIPIAHRGLHDDQAPENSLAAFTAAANLGYGIELDIHCTLDNRLVVTHDDNMLRMTGKDLRVADSNADALTGLTLNGTRHTVPLLDDVLLKIAGHAPLLIEVKTGSPMARVGPALERSLADYHGDVAVQSFDPRVLSWMKSNLPHIPRGQLSGSFKGENVGIMQKWLLRTMALNSVTRPHFIAYDVRAMPSPFVSIWRFALRIPLLLWTVRSVEDLSVAMKNGANIIFEDIDPS